MATYLDFEQNIKQLDDSIANARIKGDEAAVEILQKNLNKEINKVYANLNEMQRLALARHPDRLYALDYINALIPDKHELHGDRHFSDDQSIVAFIGTLGGERVMAIGEQKGRGTKNKIERNFGMPNPEGYRKALRFAKLAEKFEIPIIFFVDTPGAYPGVGAEERGQSEAIARNLFELAVLKTRIISIVIGEGGSGGALAISVADKLAMLSNSIYSVISPEGCAAILWKDPAKIETATKAMKITASELKKQGIIDDIIEEPKMGAHRDTEATIKLVGDYILQNLEELKTLSIQEVLDRRMQKLLSIGHFEEKAAK